MGLDFYYILASAPCRGPMMVAKALGVELNLKKVDLFNKEQLKPEFVAINPQHVVPTLVDGDFTIWESKAIIGYLVGQYGKDDSLYPKDPKKRAVVDKMLYFDMNLHQTFRNWAHPAMKEGKIADPANLEKLHVALGHLDDQLKRQNSAFVTGDELCVADFTLVAAVATYRALGVDISRHPAIEAWMGRCAAKMEGYEDIVEEGSRQMAKQFKECLDRK